MLVDFGPVIVGHCKVVTVQLLNERDVPCDWKAGSSLLQTTKDSTGFSVTPDGGTLRPGERINLEIRFTPSEVRKWLFPIPIRVTKNPNAKNIVCKGDGVNFDIRFFPPTVEIGPILPLAQEGAAIVKVRNNTSFPAEIFSLDYDTQYLQEEELLRNTDGFVDGIMLLPPREPGESLASHLARHKAAESAPPPIEVQKVPVLALEPVGVASPGARSDELVRPETSRV